MTASELHQVAEQFRDGMRIGIGGFWFVRTPMALTDALLDSNARNLEIVCFGGGLAIERLIAERRVQKIFFSFHSMDILGPAPEFRAALEAGTVEGVELTTLMLTKALRAAEENLPHLPIRGPEESAFVEGPYPLPALECPLTGQQLRAVPALPLDVSLVHATRSDPRGNVEIVGAHGLDLRLLGAARHRIASVEEETADFKGPQRAHLTTIPRFLTDQVIVAPKGASPSSCLPYYSTDLTAIQKKLGFGEQKPTSSPDLTTPAFQPLPGTQVSRAELLVCALARQLVDGGVYTVGSVTPVAMVAYQLAKHTHAPGLTLIPFAGLVDVDFYSVTVAHAEDSALASAADYWGMEDLYERLYQAGRIDAEIFCPAQIDQYARINNSRFTRDGSMIRLPGQAGIADVATMHKNLYMYLPRHSSRRLVTEVSFHGGSRYLVGDDERVAAGFQPGEITLVTDLCTLRQDKSTRRLELESIHPGVNSAEVVAQTGFPLTLPTQIPTTITPDSDVLQVLRREVDPHGVRELETHPSSVREQALSTILAREYSCRKER